MWRRRGTTAGMRQRIGLMGTFNAILYVCTITNTPIASVSIQVASPPLSRNSQMDAHAREFTHARADVLRVCLCYENNNLRYEWLGQNRLQISGIRVAVGSPRHGIVTSTLQVIVLTRNNPLRCVLLFLGQLARPTVLRRATHTLS